MAINVLLPTPLRDLINGEDTFATNGANVSAVLDNLMVAYPVMRDRLFDAGKLRRSINVFVNGEDIRFLDNGATALNDGDELSILPAFAGG